MELETLKKNTTDKIGFLERKVDNNTNVVNKLEARIRELEDDQLRDQDLIKHYK